jgi:chromate reductase
MHGTEVRILGISGSLRKGSYNTALLYAAKKMMPDNSELEIFDLSGIPEYNQDTESNPPEKVVKLKRKIKEADALLISTPEYNYSIPGVLKNAIDWSSRPDNPFDEKPAAIMSASIGAMGGSRAQYHLRQIFIFLNVYAVVKPEVIVTFASEKISENGELKDTEVQKRIGSLLNKLIEFSIKLKQ